MPHPEQRTCGNCVFFERKGDPEERPYRRRTEGQCRRYALRPGPLDDAQWPDTQEFFWCGEWRSIHPTDTADSLQRLVSTLQSLATAAGAKLFGWDN